MKIQLIYPDVDSFHGLAYHPGLASIAAVMAANGHEVKIGYFNDLNKKDVLLKAVKTFKPDMIGFTSVETQFHHVRGLSAEIKAIHDCLIVCGGPYVTLFPEAAFEAGCHFDAIIRGEGEYAMLELAKKVISKQDWRDVPNLAFLSIVGKNRQVVKNKLRPLINDLDSLPYPTTELFNYQGIINERNIAMFYFNRGCPYFCGYCSNSALGGAYGLPSNAVRLRSVNSVMKEIEHTISKYDLKDTTLLHFGDDLFIFNKKWIIDFCAIYREKINRPFWCTGRSNHIDDEICAALKSANCALMMMSVESGNDYIRNEVMRRNISREAMFQSFKRCANAGIKTLATCIIGLPFETPEMIEDSIKTVAHLESVAEYGINIFYPYKGTHLRTVCEEHGFIDNNVPEDFLERKESVLNLPKLSKQQINYYYNNWLKLIMRHKSRKERLKFALITSWVNTRSTLFGKTLRAFLNQNSIGKLIKRKLMQLN